MEVERELGAVVSVEHVIGARLRKIRREAGLTQQDVAHALGLSFQQVQKYERGVNRISAGKIYQIAQFLKVDITEFFVDLTDTDHMIVERSTSDDERMLLTHWARLPLAAKRQLLEMVALVAEYDEAARNPERGRAG